LGKIAGIGFKTVSAVAPIVETIQGVAQIRAAEEFLKDLSRQREESEVAIMRSWGYAPVYRDGIVIDYVKIKRPASEVEPRPKQPKVGSVYSVRGLTLHREEVRLSERHIPITFYSWTGEGEKISDVTPRIRIFEGYALRKDHVKLAALARMQIGALRLATARERPTSPAEPEVPDAPSGERGTVVIVFSWWVGDAGNSIEASAENVSSRTGSWTATTLEGSLEDLRAVTDSIGTDQPLPEYELIVRYKASNGSETELRVVQSSADSNLREEGEVPAHVMQFERYPEDSAVSYILENYGL
jgi:hypothetical protein